MEVIRELTIDDLEQILELRIGIQNYDLKYLDLDRIQLTKEELLDKTRNYIAENLNSKLFLFGLFINNKLVANCGFYFDKHFPTYDNPTGYIGYICNVFTKEEYRGRGYQKKIFETTMNYAKQLGITNFKLSSLNDIAIKMYKSFGFKESNNAYSLKI